MPAMDDIARAAFDEATAMGHHWAGEEHFVLAVAAVEPPLLPRAGVTHEKVAAAVAAHADPPFPKTFDGCLSAPSYHTILGRARGFALGAGRAGQIPADFLAALLWDPAGVPTRLIEAAGGTRPAAIDLVASLGLTVPASPPVQRPLADAAERQAVALGHPFFGDDHVVLALLAGDPDAAAGEALRRAGVTHDRLAARIAAMIANSHPPVTLPPAVTSAAPNPRCAQLLGCAEGLAAARADGKAGSTEALVAYLWQPDGDQVITLEGLDTSAARVLAQVDHLGIATPAPPLPEPDRTPWGERVDVPAGRMSDVIARLTRDLPLGSWGCNSHDGRDWVVAHAHIDLAAIVAEVVAS
jgi:hypothetical protein